MRSWLLVVSVVTFVLFGLYVYEIRPIKTAGNATIWFSIDIQLGRLEDAYARLCQSEKERLSMAEFIESGGEEYAFLSDITLRIRGGEKEYAGELTLDRAIDEAWTELDSHRTEDVSTWRLQMRREGEWLLSSGDWKVCGIESRGQPSTP